MQRLASRLALPLSAMLLCGCPGPERTDPAPSELVPTIAPTPTPEPPPPPLPETLIPFQKLDTAKLYNGIEVKSSFSTEQGTLATKERADPQSYTLELKLNVRVPEPNNSLEEIQGINPALPTVLPGLNVLMESAKVSNFWHGLYENKVAFLQPRLNRLDALLSRHNFYDCETILEMSYPETGRKLLFIQSEMDVNGDGSDGDRELKVDQTSSTFQPFTSYRWPKKTKNPNEFLVGRETRLAELEAEFKESGLSIERNRELRTAIASLKAEVAELKTTSYLLSRADPSIVVPGFMLRYRDHPYAPKIGDYAVVVHGDRLYPAIVGDAGPSNKMGEASLRICREIDSRSGVYRRPESDLKVTYLIFPGTAERPFGPPDLDRWHKRCEELLAEVGGHGGTLHQWEDLTQSTDRPEPTQVPTSEPKDAAAPGAEAEVAPPTLE